MAIYRHYKNKFYKYLGLVRHSETLEELVLYDTLYENDKGRTWVRPKSLFFGDLKVDGVTQPRFAPVKLDVRERFEISEQEIAALAPLIEATLGRWYEDQFRLKLKKHSKFYLLIAYLDDQALGFKLGFELSPDVFYSWLGGVKPEYRRFGVATELMNRQHEWCRGKGYKSVRTKTMNHFRPMLLLNVREGFQITGTEESEIGLKIVLEKSL